MSLSAREPKRWLWSLILLTPILLFYLAHFYASTKLGVYPTGFIQYDQLGYMAFARQHFNDGFHFFYNNPFSIHADAPHIYFQPHIFLLALLQQILPFSEGTIYLLFGFAAALCCVRIILALYEKLAGLESAPQKLGLLLFLWGGGFIGLWGLFQNILSGQPFPTAFMTMFDYEPAEGWWFLNLGRNLLFPTEAYYHALFFGCLFFLLERKFLYASLFTLILSISHPFAGLQLLLILLAWQLIELVFIRKRPASTPLPFLLFAILMLAIHLGYYLFFLNQFAEHRAIYSQWKLDWILPLNVILPAYLLVGIFAFWNLRRIDLAESFLKNPLNRLFLTGALVSFALANHDLIVAPHQPIHFTRGYIWSFLFLLGAQPFSSFLQYLYHSKKLHRALLFVFCLLFLSDNLAWFSIKIFPSFIPSSSSHTIQGIVLSPDEKQLIDWLSARPSNNEILLCENERIIYYTTAYTPYRSWKAHAYTSPNVEQRSLEMFAFFQSGKIAPEMQNKTFLVIFLTNRAQPFKDTLQHASSSQKIFQNNQFTVFEMHL